MKSPSCWAVFRADQVLDMEGKPLIHCEGKPKVAFICVHNSCRSQIAEALGKRL